MNPDVLNAIFEFGGGCLIWLSVRQLWLDKELKGVHWSPIIFFWAWGMWNLFYYPSLDQWWSFAGGLWIVLANGVWMCQIIYYKWITSAATSGRDDANPTAPYKQEFTEKDGLPYFGSKHPGDNT